MLALAAATAATGPHVITPPDATPLYCLDSTLTEQPFNDTNWGVLKAAFKRQFDFSGSVTGSGEGPGTITFHGGEGGAETISYVAWPDKGGIVLVTMKVRLRGKTDDLRGNEMCFGTLGIVMGG